MKGQVIAIAMVIASGVATFIMSVSTMQSLKLTQETFYKEYRFAEVFASLKRAPESLRSRIQEIPGVAYVETRVSAAANIDIPDFSDPATGHIISIPDSGRPLLNNLYLRQGRLPEPFREDAIVVGESFEGVVSAGESLIEIGNPRALEIQVDVLSADAVRIRPGMPVLFERWGGDKPLHGRVRSIEPAGFTKISALGVEEQRVLVISDIVSPPGEWNQLGDGYRVDASFIIWEDNDVLQIPSSSLFRSGKGWSVFVMKNRKAQLRAVETGYRNGLNAQIVSGLSGGEVVIPHPDNSIKDGGSVRPR